MSKPSDWQSAGLNDPSSLTSDERLALLTFLDEQGLSVEEMVAANGQGRLFALAGDRELRGGVPTRSLADVANELRSDDELVRAVWKALGLEEPASAHHHIATENDLRAVRTAMTLIDMLGEAPGLGLLRTYSLAMAHCADAVSGAFRAVSAVSVRRSGSELTTAKTWFELTRFVGDVGHLLDVVHRHRIDASRRLFEAAGTETDLADSDREVRLGIAFIDLSGFTALSQALAPTDLAQLLAEFERTTHELAAHHSCRVVKFIGDAAMLVAPDPLSLVQLSFDITRAFTEPTAARAGVAFGDVIAREGDYFGHAVNLAARLIAAAPPATVVTTSALAERLTGWRRRSLGTREFRGLSEPIEVVQVFVNHG